MAVDEDHSKIMERYQLMKRSLKEALLENEVLQEELRRAQTKLLQITKEKQSLMDRLQARYHEQQYSDEYTSDEDVRWQQHSFSKGVYGKAAGGASGGGGTGRGSGRGRGGYSAAQRKQQQQQHRQEQQQHQHQQQHQAAWQHQTQGSGASRRKQMPIPASHFDDGGSTSSQEPPVKRKKSMGPGAAAYAASRTAGAAPGAPDSMAPHEGRHYSQAGHFAPERHSFGSGPAGDDGARGGAGSGGGGGPGVASGIYEDSVSFDSRHGSYDERMQYNDNVYYSINESDDSDEHYYPQHVS